MAAKRFKGLLEGRHLVARLDLFRGLREAECYNVISPETKAI